MMSVRSHNTTSPKPELTENEQKGLIIDAIEKRFPETDFDEWPYYKIGHLLNYQSRGRHARDYSDFFIKLLMYIAAHELTASFRKEVDESCLEIIHELLSFFSHAAGEEDYRAFVSRFNLHLGRTAKPADIVYLAKEYLTGSDLERVLAANPGID